MNELESSLHLTQPPLYGTTTGRWSSSFIDAVKDCGEQLTWDPAAILLFNYACGDRTLLKQVKRRPWLPYIGPDGQTHLEKIPSHGRLWKDYDEIIVKSSQKRLNTKASCINTLRSFEPSLGWKGHIELIEDSSDK